MPYKDQEKRRAKSRRYYAENRDRIRWQQHDYHAKYKGGRAGRKKRKNPAEAKREDDSRYRAKHAEAIRVRAKEFWERNRRRILEQRMATAPTHPDRLRRQEATAGRPRPDRCEVCGGNGGRITFDHCHAGGHFRGWLCSGCNTILGLAKDDVSRLLALVAYLTTNKEGDSPQLSLPL